MSLPSCPMSVLPLNSNVASNPFEKCRNSSESENSSTSPGVWIEKNWIFEYGNDVNDRRFPVSPWASMEMIRLFVNMSWSRTVLNAATGCSSFIRSPAISLWILFRLIGVRFQTLFLLKLIMLFLLHLCNIWLTIDYVFVQKVVGEIVCLVAIVLFLLAFLPWLPRSSNRELHKTTPCFSTIFCTIISIRFRYTTGKSYTDCF